MVERRLLTVLLIGRVYSLAWALPQLLSRAGFCVDIITSDNVMRGCRFVRNCIVVPNGQSLIPSICARMGNGYDWFVVTEDETLREILESELSVEDKLKILPVQREKDFCHLFSKIGLSKVFSKEGVNTPSFVVASSVEEAMAASAELGYPVLLKVDSSGGGYGVFECSNVSDFGRIQEEIFKRQVLVQKKISGVELDLSAIYLKGELVHFSHAKFEKVCLNKFGPSYLRTYRPLKFVDKKIFQELAHIGRVLGVHGFTNISCIESGGQRFYFEVDVRPNVWVEMPKFFEEDPAVRIRKWFSKREKLHYEGPIADADSSEILVPYFLRLSIFELLINRYNVWKFVPLDDRKLIVRLIARGMVFQEIKSFVKQLIKRVIPKRYHGRVRKLFLNARCKDGIA